MKTKLINKDKPERCSTKPFCPFLMKHKGTYHCTITAEEVDHGDEEDGSDYIFIRTKSCLEETFKSMETHDQQEALKSAQKAIEAYNSHELCGDVGTFAGINSMSPEDVAKYFYTEGYCQAEKDLGQRSKT